MVMTMEAELQHCKSCNKDFGTDVAKKCLTCHSYICPYCKRCLCDKEDIFSDRAWDKPCDKPKWYEVPFIEQ